MATMAELLGINPNAPRAPIVDVQSMMGDPTVRKPSAGDILRANYAQTGAYGGGRLGAGQSPLFVQMMEAGYTQDDIAKALLAVDSSYRLTPGGLQKSAIFGDPYANALNTVGGQLNKWNAGAADRTERARLSDLVNTAQTDWRTAQRTDQNSSAAWQASQNYWDARNQQRLQPDGRMNPNPGARQSAPMGNGVAPDWLRGNEVNQWGNNFGEQGYRLTPQGGNSGASWTNEQNPLNYQQAAGPGMTLGRLTGRRR